MTRRTRVAAAASVGLIAVAVGLGRLTTPTPQPAPPPAPRPVGWVARTGDDRLFHPFRESGGRALAFVLGGRAILSAGGGVVCLFDADTGALRHAYGRPLDRPWPAVGAAGVLPGGTRAIFFESPPEAPGHIVVWDLARWKEVERSPFDPGWLRPKAFSPDGRYFVGTDPSWGGLVVCDLMERSAGPHRSDRPAARHMAAHRAVAFTPDGPEFVTGSSRVEVYDAATGKVARVLGELPKLPPDKAKGDLADEPMSVILGAAVVSSDGRWVVETGAYHPWIFGPFVGEAVARVRDLRTGRVVREIPTSRGWLLGGTKRSMPSFDRFAFTPDGKRLLVAGAERRVTTRDVETGRKMADWSTGPPDPLAHISDLAVSPDGARVVTAEGDFLRVWDAATGRELLPRAGHTGGVGAVAFSPDGRTLYTLGGDRRLHAWDPATGRLLRAGEKLPFGWDPPRLTPDARWLVTTRTGADYKAIDRQLHDPATGEVRFTVPVSGFTPVPNRDEAVLTDGRSALVVRGLAGGPPRVRLEGVGDYPHPVVSADGTRLFLREYGSGPLSLWDLGTGTKLASWRPTGVGLRGLLPGVEVGAVPIALSRDGRRAILTVSQWPTATPVPSRTVVCEAMTGRVLWEHVCGRLGCLHYCWSDTAAFSPDGRLVAIGGDRLTVHDAVSGWVLAAFDGHRGGVSALAFSPDGARLASGGRDGTAIVWDVARK